MRLELTQEQVARAVGFDTTVYGRIERGDMVPSTPKLRALCDLLGVSADVVLALRPDESVSPATAPEGTSVRPLELRRLILLLRDLPPDRFQLFLIALEAIAHPDEE